MGDWGVGDGTNNEGDDDDGEDGETENGTSGDGRKNGPFGRTQTQKTMTQDQIRKMMDDDPEAGKFLSDMIEGEESKGDKWNTI